jgi:hypothetical protein
MEPSALFNQMVKVENAILECNLINKKSLHLFQVILREKEVNELKEDEGEIIRDIDQMMLKEER